MSKSKMKQLAEDFVAGLITEDEFKESITTTTKSFMVNVEVTHRLRFLVENTPQEEAVRVAEEEALNICPVQVTDSEHIDKVFDSQITDTRVTEIEE